MITELFMTFFSIIEVKNVIIKYPQHSRLVSHSFHRWERASQKRQANTCYTCSNSDTYAALYADSMIMMTCRMKSLIKDKRPGKVLFEIWAPSACLRFWHWKVHNGSFETTAGVSSISTEQLD